MQRSARSLAIVCSLALAGWAAGHTRLDSQRHFASTQRYEDVYHLPPPRWLNVFSLGHREALAGLIWMRMLVYFGEEIVQRGPSRHLFTYADAIVSLDPRFVRAYRWIATAGAYRPGTTGLVDVQKGIAYLERAALIAPDDGDLAWDLGSFYLYELRPLLTDEAAREEARRKGLEHMRAAVVRGAGPPWVALSTVANLEAMGQREQQIAFLQEAYTQVSEPMRVKIAAKLAKLQSASFAEAFTRAQQEAEALRARDYPYLDADLFVQVGAKPAYDHLPLLIHDFDPKAVQGAIGDDDDMLEGQEEPPP